MDMRVHASTVLGGAGLLTFAVSGAARAASEGGSLPQLDLATYPSQIFWLVVTFIILYLMMTKVALPRISEVMEARQARISADLEKATTMKNEAETVRAEYEKALAEARGKAQAQLRQTSDEIAAANTKAEGEAAQKTAVTLQEAEKRIAAAKDESLSNVKSVASEAAGLSIKRLVGLDIEDAKLDAAVDSVMEGRS
jgi:F-type H+-transporting ATPase subunit b